MARRSKGEYLRSIYQRYQRAPRAEKGMILEEFCQVCGYNRKYAIWLLNRPLPKVAVRKRTVSRSPTYSQAMVRILAKVWEASGYLCSQRLKAALVHWLPWIRQHFELTQPLEAQLLGISARQMDRRLRATKHIVKRRLYGTTRPGSLLKQMIPIKTDHWDVNTPGYLEIDLVSHSGASAVGEFLHSLDCVDIATCWVERKAVMGKGSFGIFNALTEIEHKLPFPLKGIDSDNGSEFINNHLLTFCQQRSADRAIQFTRSRPYKKDDNAHIEQKNWTHVRKLMGWDRYDTTQALEVTNQLYEELRTFQNLFQPSMKLRCKIRKGSRLIRRYDTPRTPFERVVESRKGDPKKLAALAHTLKTTDPFELSGRIDQQLQRLYKLASHADRAPRERLQQTPWRNWTFSKRLQRQQQDMKRQMGQKFG
ncbi:MAG: integrase [Candidatus Methylomirabilales bacterium]